MISSPSLIISWNPTTQSFFRNSLKNASFGGRLLDCKEEEEEEVVVVVLALEKLKALYFREVKANLDLEGLEDCASLL